jgi:hypothetical protein
MKKVMIISLLLIGVMIANAQCGKGLYDKAISELGANVKIVDVLNVSLERSNPEGLVPISKFPMHFKKETTYKFAIFWNDAEGQPNAILQVIESGVLKGSSCNVGQNKYFHSFTFKNPFNREGEVLIYFEDGKPGCATAIIAEVINTEE